MCDSGLEIVFAISMAHRSLSFKTSVACVCVCVLIDALSVLPFPIARRRFSIPRWVVLGYFLHTLVPQECSFSSISNISDLPPA